MRVCLVDGLFGVYVPQRFTQMCASAWGVSEEDRRILLAGPDHPDYWEVWDDVLSGAKYVDAQGRQWRLEQDGDLFAVADDADDADDVY